MSNRPTHGIERIRHDHAHMTRLLADHREAYGTDSTEAAHTLGIIDGLESAAHSIGLTLNHTHTDTPLVTADT